MRDPSQYKIDGQRVPSVTEIFKICGVTDLSGIPEEALEKARARGHRVHEWTEDFDVWFQKPQDHLRPAPWKDIEGYCEAYLSFLDETGFEVQDIEKTVVNRDYRYAGQLDRSGIFPSGNELRIPEPGMLTVLDIKNVHPPLRPETSLQTAAYYMAMGLSWGNRCSLNLRPDGSYQLKFYPDKNDFHDWLSLVRVAHWKLRHGLAELPKEGE